MKASAIFAALKTLIEAGRGEPQERRSAGCADAGAIGPHRSGVAISGEASQRAGTSRSHDDSGTCRTGAGTHRAGQHGSRTGEVLRRALARLQRALEPLLATIEELSERIVEYNDRIEALAQTSYPQVALLKQIKGVGTLIPLTFRLTLEDPHRFGKSRDVGCYLGLQPGRRNSGKSEPQLHISKEGDPYLRTLLVQGAQHILGPFGIDCDLRRWGLKLAERGGRNGKKRAIVATARKLAVLLHHLWVSGEVYEPLHNSRPTTVAAAA